MTKETLEKIRRPFNVSMEERDWFQQDREEWKQVFEEEFSKHLSWKLSGDEDALEVDVSPILADPIVSAVSEYGHMVHRGALERAIGLVLHHMTVGEREMAYLLLDAFSDKNRQNRYSIPAAEASNFYLQDDGVKLSKQFNKMCHVPGISLPFNEAMEIVWEESHAELVSLTRRLLTILVAFWGDYVENEKFGGITLSQWIECCRDLLDECLLYMCGTHVYTYIWTFE